MRAGEIDLVTLPFPVVLRPGMPVSDEDLIQFSERNKPYKIERNREGELIIMTPVGGIGGTHEFYVASMLFAWIEGAGGGIGFGPNTGFNLPDGSCLAPDAAWLALDRWNALTTKEQTGYPPLCPDFIVEVRSQSDARSAAEEKMGFWMDNGAKLAWLIDPIAGNVTVYRPGKDAELLERPDVVRGSGPVEGFELKCARLWAQK